MYKYDLGDWSFVCFIEDRDGCSDTFTIYTFMCEYRALGSYDSVNPGNNFYLMRLKVNCYNFDKHDHATWKILGKISDLGKDFIVSNIVVGKLIK